MGEFRCGSGRWTIVMKTDGTKVKQGQFARQLSITFQKMVSFYFFVDFSNVLHLYFLVIFITTLENRDFIIWCGDILPASSEQNIFIIKLFDTWASFTEHLPLVLSFLEQQESLQICRRKDWFWQTRNQIALLLGDELLKDLSWNEGRLNNKIRGHSPKCQLIVRTYRWRNIPSCFTGP